jgi:iron complex outermembrane receptor protein
MTRNKTRPLVATTGFQCTAAAVALALGHGPALAQTEAATLSDESIEEIVVTGSRLMRRDFSAPSPITTISREALAFSGQVTLEATLNKLPQITPDFDRTANNPGNGTARVNLRGLGSNRTLVMLNGRRLASAGIGSSVDVNSLPQALMERVEVITGGATTVYGSDAVAGVVNFVTRTDFEGFGLDTSVYGTEQGDSTIYDINLTFGHQFSNGKGNVTLFAGHYDRESLFMSEREFTQVQWIDTWEGELEQGGSSAVPEGIIFSPRIDFGNGDGAVRTIFEPNGDPRAFVSPDDFYNYAPVNYLQTPLKRSSAGAFLNYDLTDNIEAYTELTFTRSERDQNLAPVPVFANLVVNLDNPALTPATSQLFADNLFPAGPNQVAGFFGRRMLESGARIIESTSDYSRVVAGLRGELTDNWDFDAWVIYNKADQDETLRNAVSFSRFQQGLLVDPATGQCFDPSNGCVPVNMFGLGNMSPEAVAFVNSRPLDNPISRTQKSFSAFVRGDLFATWAGPIQTAIGVEFRNDEGSFKADDLIFEGDILGYNGDAPVNGSEDVSEVYVEAILPLAEDAAFADYLALELGARYSDYKNAGEVDSYKAGFEWLPNQSVRFRAMYQRSVRAPNLLEAFQEQFSEIGPYVAGSSDEDPCSATANPVATGNAEKCVITGLPANQIGVWEATVGVPVTLISGGNPNLTPESAETYTIGAVFTLESLPNLQVSVDYFDLKVEDTIGDLTADVACFDSMNTSGLFCNAISRNPTTFDIVEIFEPKINRGLLSTKGIDTQINWSTDLPGALAIGNNSADLVVDLVWTHMTENSFQETSFGTTFDCAKHFGWPCNDSKSGNTFPGDRVTANFNYTSGNFNTFLNWRWISSANNAAPYGSGFFGFPDPDLAVPTIPSKSFFDLGFGYRFGDNIIGRLSIANLTETSPAFMADAGKSANTDTSMYDIFGRSYTLSFSLQY